MEKKNPDLPTGRFLVHTADRKHFVYLRMASRDFKNGYDIAAACTGEIYGKLKNVGRYSGYRATGGLLFSSYLAGL